MRKMIQKFAILFLSAFCMLVYAQNTETEHHTTFKGMELHSWHETEAGWCFSLLQGSNYRKTMKEITDPSTKIVGMKNLKESLARLPVGEHVFWVNYASKSVSAAMLDDLLQYAQQIPIKLQFLDASHMDNGKKKKAAKELGDALIKATISGGLDKNSSVKEILIGNSLKKKLLGMRDMFDHSCYTKVLSGDAPSVGDSKASFHFFLICHEEAKIGIRLRFDEEKERLYILGYWTSDL